VISIILFLDGEKKRTFNLFLLVMHRG